MPLASSFSHALLACGLERFIAEHLDDLRARKAPSFRECRCVCITGAIAHVVEPRGVVDNPIERSLLLPLIGDTSGERANVVADFLRTSPSPDPDRRITVVD